MSVQYTIPPDNQLFLTTIKASQATLKKTSKLMYDHRTRNTKTLLFMNSFKKKKIKFFKIFCWGGSQDMPNQTTIKFTKEISTDYKISKFSNLSLSVSHDTKWWFYQKILIFFLFQK